MSTEDVPELRMSASGLRSDEIYISVGDGQLKGIRKIKISTPCNKEHLLISIDDSGRIESVSVSSDESGNALHLFNR